MRHAAAWGNASHLANGHQTQRRVILIPEGVLHHLNLRLRLGDRRRRCARRHAPRRLHSVGAEASTKGERELRT